ncbi:hypothetical protein [Fischerella thermalis]|uniref:hypothetical protein n=1 Tax=Fischerella thermalis TaxID=372787 RepID=UPI0027E52B86|nr:hypothetical protein [Fischerella thermalis]
MSHHLLPILDALTESEQMRVQSLDLPCVLPLNIQANNLYVEQLTTILVIHLLVVSGWWSLVVETCHGTSLH